MPFYVFEFKVDDTPDDAFAQINSKEYSISYQADHRAVVNIGVNFDSTTRTIGGWKIVSAPTSNKKSPLLITNLFLFRLIIVFLN